MLDAGTGHSNGKNNRRQRYLCSWGHFHLNSDRRKASSPKLEHVGTRRKARKTVFATRDALGSLRRSIWFRNYRNERTDEGTAMPS